MPFSKEEHKKYKSQFTHVDVFTKTHRKVKKKAKDSKKTLIAYVDDVLIKSLGDNCT